MKRSLLFFSIFMIPLLLNSLDFTIHYHRYNNDYDGWGLHLWGAVEESGGTFIINGQTYNWQNALPFDQQDAYGVYAIFPIIYETEPLGFIVHKGEEKDPPGLDRYFDDYDITTEIWLLQGIAEIFYEEPSTEIRIQSVIGDGINTIQVIMTGPIENYEERFQVFKEGVEEQIESVSSSDDMAIDLILVNPIDITVLYEVYDNEADLTVPVLHQFPVDEYVYSGNDLGFTYSPVETTFKLWSPVASAVNVLIYDTPTDTEEEPESYEMTRIEDGVLFCTISGDLKNKYYLYELTMMGETHTSQDPYSKAISTNSFRSMIFDKDETDPEDWDEDEPPVLEHPVDAIVYEVHIRDLTINETWEGTEENRGKYLGMVEQGTTYEDYPTGFDHILDLGVNFVQILPMYDFGSVDETNPVSRNWGYDPMSYNTPEGSYSTNPEDISRILEMKSMIKGFHDAGIKIIMDVVYNHTYYVGDGSFFDKVVPKYYYQLDDSGEYINYTGCGNTIDTSKPMVRNFIIQSVKYWVEEYHIDGFRFDLMGLIETDLMEELVDTLQTIKPDILVYGEPWGGWGAPVITGKGDQRGKDFGCFNDNIRNGIRGDTDGLALGYAMGQTNNWWAVERGVIGSITDFTDGPSETINYISAHDNYTWWDKLKRTVTMYPDEAIELMDKFGIAIVMTSQGVAFMHAGSEFLRTKRAPGATEEEVRNSYNANDDVNKLDWQRKADNIHIYNYYKGLIELRKARPEFRLRTAEDIEDHIHFWEDNPNGTMTYKIDDITQYDDWGDIIVSYNPTGSTQYISLPQGNWIVVVDDDEAGITEVETGISQFCGNEYNSIFAVQPFSAMVMYKESDESLLYLSIFQNPALNNYLHFAVNLLVDEYEDLSLTINEEPVELEQIEGGSWIADYEMTSAGYYELILSVDDYNFIRNFSVGSLGRDAGWAQSSDGKVSITFPSESFQQNIFFAIFDYRIKFTLENGCYEIGTNDICLNKPATITFETEEPGKAIYYFDSYQWIELPTTFQEGYISAQTDQLGIYKLGEAINSLQITKIIGNYPNPFNPETKINFDIAAVDNNKQVKINVYNIKGQLVKTLLNENLACGSFSVTWNGKNNSNRPVSTGVYFFRMQINSKSYSQKMLLLK